jgi:hypothetical protein
VSSTAKQQLSRNPQNAGYSNPIKTYPVPAVTNEDGTISVPAQPVYGIDPNHEPIDMYLATRSILGGTPTALSQTMAIGNTFAAVPAGRRWRIQSFVSDTTASATVGNRVIIAQVRDNAGVVVWVGPATGNVAAAQIGGYDVVFGGGAGTTTVVRRNIANTANTNVQVLCSCGIIEMRAGWTIVILDTAAIDNADVTVIRVVYTEYDA